MKGMYYTVPLSCVACFLVIMVFLAFCMEYLSSGGFQDSPAGGLGDYRYDMYDWFNTYALNEGSMEQRSGWALLEEGEFSEMVMETVSLLDPFPAEGASVYELGCGVGAVFQVLRDKIGIGPVAGCDVAENAIAVAKESFPECSHRLSVANMTGNLGDANSYDHTISLGALAMYLEVDEMKEAFSEALRITKPGGSLVFSQFVEPGLWKDLWSRGSIIAPVPKATVQGMLEDLGAENICIKDYELQTPHTRGRYIVALRKKLS